MVDEELIALLVCPNCRGPIEYRSEQQTIVCTGECRYEYPVVDDIPHMLVEEAVKP
ncbi:MAG: Trm112 family protein [Actinomycetota bacterium]